jgi:hypothetical protein
VDVILVDWTRMGRSYCLAGAVVQGGQIRIVRPMPARARNATNPNIGWSPYLMDGHSRWEVFEMVQPKPISAVRPHLEDVSVQALRSRKQLATAPQRRAILRATLAPPDQSLFGAELSHSVSACYLEAGAGERSLTTLLVPSSEIQFTALWRDGATEPDYRVRLPLPGFSTPPILPVKDHFLLVRAEKESTDLDVRLRVLRDVVRQMGEQIAVRLGLSRSFQAADGQPGRCWLMADGFFSAEDPQA